jgi:hypothetical protein
MKYPLDDSGTLLAFLGWHAQPPRSHTKTPLGRSRGLSSLAYVSGQFHNAYSYQSANGLFDFLFEILLLRNFPGKTPHNPWIRFVFDPASLLVLGIRKTKTRMVLFFSTLCDSSLFCWH